MPPPRDSLLVPGTCVRADVKSRPFGSSSTCSARMLVERALWRTSTSGVSAVTLTVSVTPDSGSEKSTFLICPSETAMPSAFFGAKPLSEAETA